MDKILEIDLNEVISQQIAEKISSLEEQLKSSEKENYTLSSQISKLKYELNKVTTNSSVIDYIRKQFEGFESDKISSSDYEYKSKEKKQYLYILNILSNLFNIQQEYGGWLSHGTWGNLESYLAVNYYKNKDIVINLLSLLMDNPKKEIDFIKAFVMPYDYNKEQVIEFVNRPNSCTNGAYFGIHHFWPESRFRESMPYDLIFANPIIAQKDVFELIIKNLSNPTYSNYGYFYSIPEYNDKLSLEQIQALGETLTYKITDKRKLKSDNLKSFIRNNILKFNQKTLDFMFEACEDNQFSILYWGSFPPEYQMKYLKSKPFSEIMKILNRHGCKWTDEQKQEFLKNM